MKNIKDFLNVNESQKEQVNESVAEIVTLTSSMIVILCNIYMMTGISKSDGYDSIFDVIKQWWRDRKIKKICKRLAEDSEIKEFLDLPQNKQRGKWRNLLKEKLSEEEMKYISSISRNKVSNA